MSQLATLGDVAAIGGVPVDIDEDDAVAVRATRLVELASGEVLTFYAGFDVDEAAIDAWDDFRKDALAAIVAEIASKRLNVSGAASVDPYTTVEGPQTMKLNRWELRALRDLLPADDDDVMPGIEP